MIQITQLYVYEKKQYGFNKNSQHGSSAEQTTHESRKELVTLRYRQIRNTAIRLQRRTRNTATATNPQYGDSDELAIRRQQRTRNMTTATNPQYGDSDEPTKRPTATNPRYGDGDEPAIRRQR